MQNSECRISELRCDYNKTNMVMHVGDDDLGVPLLVYLFAHFGLPRCGCPVDTSAKQKHRPNRQVRIKVSP